MLQKVCALVLTATDPLAPAGVVPFGLGFLVQDEFVSFFNEADDDDKVRLGLDGVLKLEAQL